jgi:hypothetical protein
VAYPLNTAMNFVVPFRWGISEGLLDSQNGPCCTELVTSRFVIMGTSPRENVHVNHAVK